MDGYAKMCLAMMLGELGGHEGEIVSSCKGKKVRLGCRLAYARCDKQSLEVMIDQMLPGPSLLFIIEDGFGVILASKEAVRFEDLRIDIGGGAIVESVTIKK